MRGVNLKCCYEISSLTMDFEDLERDIRATMEAEGKAHIDIAAAISKVREGCRKWEVFKGEPFIDSVKFNADGSKTWNVGFKFPSGKKGSYYLAVDVGGE